MGNTERNTFVKTAIINATISLLSEKPFDAISISDITGAAEVSRNSFYRNYADKEAILKEHIFNLLEQWDYDYNHTRKTDQDSEMYGSFFAHLKDNSDFYLLLRERNLFHLFREVYLEKYGPKPEQDNLSAYVVAFVQNGMLGWIDEWVNRGMQETAESMAQLLSSNGIN